MFSTLAQVTYQYTTTTTSSGSGFNPVVSFIYLVVLVAAIVGMWKVFEKAGEKGWKSLIPIYNAYILLEISGKPGWWVLLLMIPFVNLYVAIVQALELAKRFGKSGTFGFFGLFLFSYVGYLILGFGDAKYDGGRYNAAAKPAAPVSQ
ncbi:MAG: DUF5684 domain-containing protein [Candidatus Saccharimonadales bacterium]